MKIIIINGPNLNLLGKREPDIYGIISFEDYFRNLRLIFKDIDLEYFQSNHEGNIIDIIHEKGFVYDGIILNAGAYSHYSYAIYDAIKSIKSPVVEVHISDIENREDFRKVSVIRSACKNTFSGFGLNSYNKALEFLINK